MHYRLEAMNVSVQLGGIDFSTPLWMRLKIQTYMKQKRIYILVQTLHIDIFAFYSLSLANIKWWHIFDYQEDFISGSTSKGQALIDEASSI